MKTAYSMYSQKKHPAAGKWLIALFMIALSTSYAWADPVATVTHLRGTLSAQHADGSQVLLALRSPVQEKDVLTTEANTYARIKFTDNSETVLRPSSMLNVASYRYRQDQPKSGNILLKLLKGGLRRVTGLVGKAAPAQDVMMTPVATIGIRGTHYGLLFCQSDCGQIPTVTGEPLRDGLHADVVEGSISVKNPAGEVIVVSGQFASVKDQNTSPKLVPANEGVQVTIPPAILLNSGNGNSLDVNKCNGNCAIQ
jgi:hypothetical protein